MGVERLWHRTFRNFHSIDLDLYVVSVMSESLKTVQVVLVLYNCPIQNSASWGALKDIAIDGQASSLSFTHCLIYDNSPNSASLDEITLPPNFSYLHDPRNVGTAGAYAKAAEVAIENGCEWLLLLDQDTRIDGTFLAEARASELRSLSGSRSLDVMVPRVWHKKRLISPSKITLFGGVRPSRKMERMLTAISSGMLVKTSLLRSILPFHPELWLDYVDHWMFLQFAARDFRASLIDVDIDHELSVEEPSALTMQRLKSILAGEAVFCRYLGLPAKLALPLRRVFRAFRLWHLGRADLAAVTLRRSFAGWKR